MSDKYLEIYQGAISEICNAHIAGAVELVAKRYQDQYRKAGMVEDKFNAIWNSGGDIKEFVRLVGVYKQGFIKLIEIVKKRYSVDLGRVA